MRSRPSCTLWRLPSGRGLAPQQRQVRVCLYAPYGCPRAGVYAGRHVPRLRRRHHQPRALLAAGGGAVLCRGGPARQLCGPPVGGGLWGRVRPAVRPTGGSRGTVHASLTPRWRHRGVARAERGRADAARRGCRSIGGDASRLGAAGPCPAAPPWGLHRCCPRHSGPAAGQPQAGAALGAAAFCSSSRPAPEGAAATRGPALARGGGWCRGGRRRQRGD